MLLSTYTADVAKKDNLNFAISAKENNNTYMTDTG